MGAAFIFKKPLLYNMTNKYIYLLYKNMRDTISYKNSKINRPRYFIEIDDNLYSSSILCRMHKTSTNLSAKIFYNKIQKCTMMSRRSLYITRATYHCLTAITNQHVLDNTSKHNYDAFIDSSVTLSVDNTTGCIQHKSAFMRHLISHKFNGKIFYSSFCKTTGIQTINSVEGHTDMRVMNELPIIQIYHNTFKSGIEHIQANHDIIVGDFPAQLQTNQDFKVTIKAIFERIVTFEH
jgi:hypothetical protein